MKNWLKNWRIDFLPGLSIIGLIILSRSLGILQPLEWKAFDLGLRWRPAEPTDQRITIVGINEEDIQTVLDYPISDRGLAALIQTVQAYNPRVIGIDIFRDKPVGEGYGDLETTLQAADNIIGIHKISDTPVQAPPMLPEAQVGFSDAILDADGFLRRSFLAGADADDNYRFSLTIRLVERYLAPEGLRLENGIRDPETMRFGQTEIPRFQPNTGGYVRTDNGGNQALINFRSGTEPFTEISYKALVSGQIDPELLQDRVVLVGYTAETVKDFVSSTAIAGSNPSLIPGVEVQAHAISQILSAVYDGRPFLKTPPNGLDYVLIVGSGLLGMALAHWRRKPSLHLLLMLAISLTGLLLYYGLLVASWWLPLVPTALAFLLNAVALYPFYQSQAQLRSQLDERQKLIDWTYNTIHNGPLQILSGMLSTWPDNQPAPAALRQDLQSLNREMRGIYEAMRQEMLLPTGQIILTGQQALDLHTPLDALLYEVYQATIERRRGFFEPILKVTCFKPMADSDLTLEQKRNLGRFLEEALINVCKYAEGTTRLMINCLQVGEHNVIQVIDNGVGLKSHLPKYQGGFGQGGFGTRQAHKLARGLWGHFERKAVDPQGVHCELRWPIQPPAWKRWVKK